MSCATNVGVFLECAQKKTGPLLLRAGLQKIFNMIFKRARETPPIPPAQPIAPKMRTRLFWRRYGGPLHLRKGRQKSESGTAEQRTEHDAKPLHHRCQKRRQFEQPEQGALLREVDEGEQCNHDDGVGLRVGYFELLQKFGQKACDEFVHSAFDLCSETFKQYSRRAQIVPASQPCARFPFRT